MKTILNILRNEIIQKDVIKYCLGYEDKTKSGYTHMTQVGSINCIHNCKYHRESKGNYYVCDNRNKKIT